MAKFLAKVIDVNAATVVFSLANGLKIQAILDDLPADIQQRLTLHGLSQKIGDASAGYSKAEDFRGAFSAMQSVLDSLTSGQWATRGAANADLVTALCEVQGMDEDESGELVAAMDEETLKAVSAHPAVRAVVKRLQSERATANAKAAADTAPDLASLLKKK